MTDVIEKIKERVDELIGEFDGLKDSIDEASEWDSLGEIIANISSITNFVINIVLAVELSVNELAGEIEDITGEEKRKAAVQILDDMLDLPWYLEVIDGPAFEIILSMVVDMLNKYMGNDWNLDFIREIFAKGGSIISLFKSRSM